MSHQPQRTEKNCLNCGTTVAGRYCQQCGQENILPKQSAWGLITHFIYDVIHFDGKFFHTLKYLFFKPGFVPQEYVHGRRVSYLDPIRMYLFTSALFFLVFFSLDNITKDLIRTTDTSRLMTKVERLEYASELHRELNAGRADSTAPRKLNFLLDTTSLISLGDTAGKATNDSSFRILLGGKPYFMKIQALDLDKDLKQENNFINKGLRKKWFGYRKKYGDDDRAFITAFANSFLHKFPYLLFVSLPFFALILKLLYRRRKQFFYSDHAVFTLYHYIFTFLLLLLYFGFAEMYEWLKWGLFRWIALLLLLSGGVYLWLSMKKFYGQGWGKTTIKFLLLNGLALLVVLLLAMIFIFFSIFQI